MKRWLNYDYFLKGLYQSGFNQRTSITASDAKFPSSPNSQTYQNTRSVTKPLSLSAHLKEITGLGSYSFNLGIKFIRSSTICVF